MRKTLGPGLRRGGGAVGDTAYNAILAGPALNAGQLSEKNPHLEKRHWVRAFAGTAVLWLTAPMQSFRCGRVSKLNLEVTRPIGSQQCTRMEPDLCQDDDSTGSRPWHCHPGEGRDPVSLQYSMAPDYRRRFASNAVSKRIR